PRPGRASRTRPIPGRRRPRRSGLLEIPCVSSRSTCDRSSRIVAPSYQRDGGPVRPNSIPLAAAACVIAAALAIPEEKVEVKKFGRFQTGGNTPHGFVGGGGKR